jgi:hypothetical protein
MIPQVAHHSTVHRTRDNQSPRQHRASAMPAMGGSTVAMQSGIPGTPPPAALGRHATKQRKHSSAGPLAGGTPPQQTPQGSPSPGLQQLQGPGSTGLLVGSARPSRAMSPLQTQTTGGGTAGNPILITPPLATPVVQHPYAAGMQSYAATRGGAALPVNGINTSQYGGAITPAVRNPSPQGPPPWERSLPAPPNKFLHILMCRCG